MSVDCGEVNFFFNLCDELTVTTDKLTVCRVDFMGVS